MLYKLQGAEILNSLYKKRDFFRFKGIRYAEPPVGPRRFKDPVGVSYLSGADVGVVDATSDGPVCPQMERTKPRKERTQETVGVHKA